MKALPSIPEPETVGANITQEEIDEVNDLYADMRRRAKMLLKDAFRLGDLLIELREKLGPYGKWHIWLQDNCPKLRLKAWQYAKLAANREFLSVLLRDESTPGVSEALRVISQSRKMAKPRVRSLVVSSDADPLVLLEAKLKNYVINLWMLRYLQTEIEGMLESMELTPDQVLRVLHYVCKEHHEVEDEVLRTFKPGLKIVSKGA